MRPSLRVGSLKASPVDVPKTWVLKTHSSSGGFAKGIIIVYKNQKKLLGRCY